MSDNISIRVTADDIAKAITKDSARCVVATAIAREIPGARRISVDVQAIRFTNDKGDRITYLTPPAVTGYVVAFDAGETFGPFRFILRPDQRMTVRKAVLSDAGKAKDRVRNKATRRAKAADRVAADPTSTRAARKVAKDRAISAAEERDEVMAALKGQPVVAWDDAALPPPVPQVFKRGERAYGLRRLRINQHGTYAERMAGQA